MNSVFTARFGGLLTIGLCLFPWTISVAQVPPALAPTTATASDDVAVNPLLKEEFNKEAITSMVLARFSPQARGTITSEQVLAEVSKVAEGLLSSHKQEVGPADKPLLASLAEQIFATLKAKPQAVASANPATPSPVLPTATETEIVGALRAEMIKLMTSADSNLLEKIKRKGQTEATVAERRRNLENLISLASVGSNLFLRAYQKATGHDQFLKADAEAMEALILKVIPDDGKLPVNPDRVEPVSPASKPNDRLEQFEEVVEEVTTLSGHPEITLVEELAFDGLKLLGRSGLFSGRGGVLCSPKRTATRQVYKVRPSRSARYIEYSY